jgi:hypothetical protein
MYIYNFTGHAKEEDKAAEKVTLAFIKERYEKRLLCGGLDNLLNYGVYKWLGWAYDFTDELKKFVVKQYGQWREVYAPNKTLLRKALYGRIEKIVEI